MLVVNHELAFVAAITILVYGFVTWRLTRTLDAESDRYHALWDEVSSRIQQAIAGIKTVQAHGAEDYETARIDDASRAAYDVLPPPQSHPQSLLVHAGRGDQRLKGQRAGGRRPEGARASIDARRCRDVSRLS